MVSKTIENVGEYQYMIKHISPDVHLFDHYVSVMIHESLAAIFSSKMVTAISLYKKSHIAFVSCFIKLRAVAKLLKGLYLSFIFPDRKPDNS
jgi:hypothetical protein